MKVATYRLTPDTPGAPLDLPPEVFWARFGDEREADFRSIHRSAWNMNSRKLALDLGGCHNHY
jgi:hypothetical protein